MLANPKWSHGTLPGLINWLAGGGWGMVEMGALIFAAVAAGGVIGLGVRFGTQYIDRQLAYRDVEFSKEKPLVRPSRPSGMDWDKSIA